MIAEKRLAPAQELESIEGKGVGSTESFLWQALVVIGYATVAKRDPLFWGVLSFEGL